VADQGEGATFDDGGAEAQPSSLDRLAESFEPFESFQADVRGRFDALTERIPEPPEYEPEIGDLLDFGDFAPEHVELNEDGQRAALEQLVRQAALEEVGPLLGEREKADRMAEANALEQKYPRLRDEAFQDEMIGLAIGEANRVGKPELAREPWWLEKVYLSHAAQQRAATEVPVGEEREVTLEHPRR
jgi:hypothetical protein